MNAPKLKSVEQARLKLARDSRRRRDAIHKKWASKRGPSIHGKFPVSKMVIELTLATILMLLITAAITK